MVNFRQGDNEIPRLFRFSMFFLSHLFEFLVYSFWGVLFLSGCSLLEYSSTLETFFIKIFYLNVIEI